MGGAAAGVEVLRGLSDEPIHRRLEWMAAHARELGIMVRQVEDEDRA